MMKGPRDNLTDISDNRAWLWGPTGEQEWSPDITTGQLPPLCIQMLGGAALFIDHINT